jgi:phosphoribosylformylglycinamidine synthase
VDLAAERALATVLTAAASGGLLSAAHDLSDGGLAIALAECCLAGGTGCQVTLPGDPFTLLFSESAARAVVAVPPGSEAAFAALLESHGVPSAVLGVTGGAGLDISTSPEARASFASPGAGASFTIPLDELASVHRATLPALFG